MGNKFIDKYTYTHFILGLLIYHIFLFKICLMIHSILKLIENIIINKEFINKYLCNYINIIEDYYDIETLDTIDNIIVDSMSFLVGWLSSFILTNMII